MRDVPCDAALDNEDQTAGRYTDRTDRRDWTVAQTDCDGDLESVAGLDSD